jgi:hypothetical protein
MGVSGTSVAPLAAEGFVGVEALRVLKDPITELVDLKVFLVTTFQ